MPRQLPIKIICNEKEYRSKKHPVLEYIFFKKNPDKDTSINIEFSLVDISEAYRELEIIGIFADGRTERIYEPASISNTILDLVRQKRNIKSRLPDSIIELGFDLRKKTGDNSAGEFVYVGVGNQIKSWMDWSPNPEIINIDTSPIPDIIREFLRKDEGALFSVIDYCDVLSKSLYEGRYSIIRIQHPLKWQPNEIDGFYIGIIEGVRTLFPIEAKALTTHDEINLDQICGGVNTISNNMQNTHTHIIPLAIKMVKNGILIGVFSTYDAGEMVDNLEVARTIKVTFDPPISSWK